MRNLWSGAVRFVVLTTIALTIQWGAGAYRSEGSDNPDEPAHIVTGLMVRDYLATGWGQSPMAFARDYYRHYPKVALGHWPPVFYAEQAVWTLPFPASRSSLLVMIAVQFGVIATLVWSLLRVQYGATAAWCGALVLSTLPALTAQANTVMTEVPLALLVLLAMLAWARFLDAGRPGAAIAFGLWSALAILSKGTGVVLVGVPLLSAWLAGRLSLVKRHWFWSPALIVGVLCAPWFLLAPGAMQQRVKPIGGFGVIDRPMDQFASSWADTLGWPVTSLAVAGLIAVILRRMMGARPDARTASATALALSAAVLPLFFTSWEYRHVVESAPAFLLMAAVGVHWIATRASFGKLSTRTRATALVLGSMTIIGTNATRLAPQPVRGYDHLVEQILGASFGPASTILVSGNPLAEGLLISGIAQRERQPKRYVLRSTQLFIDADWMASAVVRRVSGVEPLHSLLLSLPVDLVVIDRVNAAPYGYQPWLESALESHPDHWQRMPTADGGRSFGVFRRIDAPPLSPTERDARLRAIVPEPDSK